MIYDVYWDNCFIDHTFPKLEEMKLSSCLSIDDAELEKFNTSNSTTKKLFIDNNNELKWVNITQAISENLQNSVELKIDQKYFKNKNRN